MADKATYGELEHRIRHLEEELTSCKRAEVALRESEAYYRLLFSAESDAIIIVDAKTKQIVDANEAAIALYGYSRDELLCLRPFEFSAEPEESVAHIEKVASGEPGIPSEGPVRRLHRKKDGTIFPVEISSGTYVLRGKRLVCAIFRDISARLKAEEVLKRARDELEIRVQERTTQLMKANEALRTEIAERARAEAALRESEELFKNIFLESPIGIAVYDSKGALLNANKSCMDIFGIQDMAQVRGGNLFDEPNMTGEVKEKLERGEPVKLEVPFDFQTVKDLNLYETTRSGIVHLDVVITPLGPKEDKGTSGHLVQIQDITGRKEAEEHVHTLTQELIKAHENERQMISRELHDGVGQDLSMLKIGLDTLLDDEPGVTSRAKERLSELSRILHGSITAIRDLAYDLRPPTLDQLGMVQTIFQYCEDFSEKSKLKVDFTSAGMNDLKLDFDTEINLYRLVQEGLNNVRKHAGAKQVKVRLISSSPNIILRIEDDGKGFDVEKRFMNLTKKKRMGLRSMEERVSLLRGRMKIQSRPNQGTKIFIEVPSKAKKSGSEEEHIDRR